MKWFVQLVVKWVSGLKWKDFLWAVEVVSNAAATYRTDQQEIKRKTSSDKIQEKFDIPASTANWLTEMAYKWLKKKGSDESV